MPASMRHVPWGGVLLLVACAAPAPDAPSKTATVPPRLDWPSYGGDAGTQRWSPAGDVTPANVATLAPAWTWRTGEGPVADTDAGVELRPGKFEATPLVVHDTLYVVTPYHRAVALDAATGRELWAFDPGATQLGLISNDHAGFVHRGLALWSGDGERRVLLATRDRLLALDAATGQPVAGFGDSGSVDLNAHLRWPVNRRHIARTSPPAVWNDVVIVGSAVGDGIIHEQDPPGDVQAFDARTGQLRWRWDPVPLVGHPDRTTWGGRSAEVTGHANVWAPMSVDTARGLVYLPVSTPSNDWYGGGRPGDNVYAESLVCLDARTGRLVWHRQLVHHGLWDYDLAAPPLLITVQRDDRAVDAVFVAAKTGWLYAFDRVTGTPLWPLEERAVPASSVPGEVAAATQPHVDWPLPFARQGFSDDDLIDWTPELRAAARALVAGLRAGPIFTPPSLEGTIVSPGWIGGAGWGSTAADPQRRLLFVKSTNLPVLARLAETGDARRYRIDSSRTPEAPLRLTLPAWRTWYGRGRKAVQVPIGKPPYGVLTAYDIDSGAIRWQVTVGDLPAVRRHPALRGRATEPLGVPGAPGPVATAGGLLFLTGGGDVLYAIGSEDGVVHWSAPLGQVGYSNPMTYRTGGGRQFVVVATGEGKGASLQAFALPDR